MNQVLSLVQAARTSPAPHPGLGSDRHLLAELLVLHEEMIVQLRAERLEVAGRSGFLTGMITQHENAAAMLRAKLGHHPVEASPEGVIVITGEASSAAAKSQVTKFAQGARGTAAVSNHMTVQR